MTIYIALLCKRFESGLFLAIAELFILFWMSSSSPYIRFRTLVDKYRPLPMHVIEPVFSSSHDFFTSRFPQIVISPRLGISPFAKTRSQEHVIPNNGQNRLSVLLQCVPRSALSLALREHLESLGWATFGKLRHIFSFQIPESLKTKVLIHVASPISTPLLV